MGHQNTKPQHFDYMSVAAAAATTVQNCYCFAQKVAIVYSSVMQVLNHELKTEHIKNI